MHVSAEPFTPVPQPAALQGLPPEAVVDLDVRPILRDGGEPFQEIMDAVGALAPGQALCLRATFEPAPLYRVLGGKGLQHWTERLADDDWLVWFFPAEDAAGVIDGTAAGAASGAAAAAALNAPPTAAAPPRQREMDVRVIPPREKHPAIFATFKALLPGESFVLVNDHDPMPLRYQFEAEHAGEFGWAYEESGPVVWRVRIERVAAA